VLVVVLPDPPGGIAGELELSAEREAGYTRIRRWCGGALGHRRGWLFCATPALARKVTDLVGRGRMGGCAGVEALPVGDPSGARG
jgi:hypothetical protein